MINHHTTCFPTPDVPGHPMPWGDPRPGHPVWPALPPWAQPVDAPGWRPLVHTWA